MICTRREHHLTTTALKTTFAPIMGYSIPAGPQHHRGVAELPAHIAARAAPLGIGKLAITMPAGRA